MTGYTVHPGASKKFVAGWDQIFGDEDAQGDKNPSPPKKSASKKAKNPTAKKTKAAKKKKKNS